MRINKWISHNTKYSRREADGLIKNGSVKINQKIAELSNRVDKEKVFINGKEIKPKDSTKYTVIVYNKPKGELVSKNDDRGRKTIYDSLGAKFSHFIPVGRLDFATEGLLLLSDNVEVVSALMSSSLVRVYNLKLDSRLSKGVYDAMENGIIIEDARAGGHKDSKITTMEFAPFDFFEVKKDSHIYTKIKVGITEGKNRELRRFFAHFGINVVDLKRVSYGFVELNAVPSGKSRYLTRSEYNKLHYFIKNRSNNANTNKRK